MKSSSYSIVKSLIVLAIANLLGQALVQFALASPVGTSYTAVLDIQVLVQPGDQQETEGHYNGEVLFDGIPVILPNDVGPGKDLLVTETYSEDPAGGVEHLSILISSGDGTPLALNAVYGGGVAELGIYNLYWDGSSAGVSIIDFVLAPSFDGGLTFEPLHSSDFFDDPYIYGTVAVDDPQGFYFVILGDALQLPIEPLALTATDLKLDLTVQAVPISGSLWLLLSGLIGLIGLRSGCRRRPDR